TWTRTATLAGVVSFPLVVREALDPDWARRFEVFLDQHPRLAECCDRLALGGGKLLLEFRMLVDTAHAAAAASCHGLDENRIADFVGLALEKGRRLLTAVIARYHRHPNALHERLGMILKRHGTDGRGRRTGKHLGGLGAGVATLCILPTKTVPRLQPLRAC